MKVKICGITNLEDALAACEFGADALGFNFAQEAKQRNRYIEPGLAEQIVGALPPFVAAVGVFVNDSVERMRDSLRFLNWIQLHGEETPEQAQALGSRVIKAFRASPDLSVDSMLSYPVAARLLDAYVPGMRGGTGKQCDWDFAREAANRAGPLILAGGLNPENVAQAIQRVAPYAVDTAGGVENEPGKKDHDRLRSFIHNAKTALS